MRSLSKNLLVTLTLFLLVQFFVPTATVSAQSSESIRQQFRKFYERKVPKLTASYSNVRYFVGAFTKTRNEIRVTSFRGAIQGAAFVFDSRTAGWFLVKDVGDDFRNIELSKLTSQFDESQRPEESGGYITDKPEPGLGYSFRLKQRSGGTKIEVSPNESIAGLFFNPYILMPISSIELHKTFEEIMNDTDIKFVDWIDATTREGRKIKSLYYRAPKYSRNEIFQADFDPDTGACVSCMEFDKQGRVFVAEAYYAADSAEPDLLPPPIYFEGTRDFNGPVRVIEYDRAGKLDPDEVSVAAFGFDPAEVGPKEPALKVMSKGAAHVLKIVAIVLFCLLVFVVGLALLIALLAKSKGKSSGNRYGEDGDFHDREDGEP